MSEFNKVKEFMEAMDQDVPALPSIPSKKVIQLRIGLIEEEITELLTSLYVLLKRRNNLSHDELVRALVEIADGVADVNYVVNGTAVAFGLDGEQIFDIVHKANMAKRGGPVSIQGKRLKPPGWKPPETAIKSLIETAWANYVAPPVPQREGIEWEGPQDENPLR